MLVQYDNMSTPKSSNCIEAKWFTLHLTLYVAKTGSENSRENKGSKIRWKAICQLVLSICSLFLPLPSIYPSLDHKIKHDEAQFEALCCTIEWMHSLTPKGNSSGCVQTITDDVLIWALKAKFIHVKFFYCRL